MGPFDPEIIPIVAVIFGVPGGIVGLALLLRFQLKKKQLEMRGSDADLGPVVDALRDDLDDTRAQLSDMQQHTQAQLAEMQERLDFAERLLTAGRASQDEKSK